MVSGPQLARESREVGVRQALEVAGLADAVEEGGGVMLISGGR
jgi:hypothetical protein